MDLRRYSPETRKYISELIRRNAVSPDTLNDKTFINFLSCQKFDEDYIRSMMDNRQAVTWAHFYCMTHIIPRTDCYEP